jgi:polyhydroxyalkanoate synthase
MRPQQATNSGNAANAFQQSLAQGWQQALASFQQMAQSSPQTGSLAFNPAQLQTLKDQYLQEATQLWNQGLSKTPVLKDRRFAGDAWGHNPMAAFSAAIYLLNTRTLMGLADALEGDHKTRERIRFAVEQWSAHRATPGCSMRMLNKKPLTARARALPKASKICGTTCAKATFP